MVVAAGWHAHGRCEQHIRSDRVEEWRRSGKGAERRSAVVRPHIRCQAKALTAAGSTAGRRELVRVSGRRREDSRREVRVRKPPGVHECR